MMLLRDVKMTLLTKEEISKLPFEKKKRHRSSGHMHLFKNEVVEEALSKIPPEELEARRAKREKRSEAGRKAVETKIEKIVEKSETKIVSLERLPKESLIKKALKHWSDHTGKETPTSPSKEFLDRICRNYLRHEMCPDYDEHNVGLKGKVGKKEAYSAFRAKLDDEIDKLYPFLAEQRKKEDQERKETEEMIAQNKYLGYGV